MSLDWRDFQNTVEKLIPTETAKTNHKRDKQGDKPIRIRNSYL